jgi:hypothetical protein
MAFHPGADPLRAGVWLLLAAAPLFAQAPQAPAAKAVAGTASIVRTASHGCAIARSCMSDVLHGRDGQLAVMLKEESRRRWARLRSPGYFTYAPARIGWRSSCGITRGALAYVSGRIAADARGRAAETPTWSSAWTHAP